MGNVDKELVHAAMRGNRSAMADLYSRNIGYLTAVCSRYLADNDDRNDVLQNSLVKIFSALGSFEYRGEGSLKAWMARIVVNEALKYLKNAGRISTVPEDRIPDIADGEEPEVDDIPQPVLQDMIRQLPDGYRTVFNLFVFEEKSHREIAGMLGITESTSASQFHRARKILADKIREYRKSID